MGHARGAGEPGARREDRWQRSGDRSICMCICICMNMCMYNMYLSVLCTKYKVARECAEVEVEV